MLKLNALSNETFDSSKSIDKKVTVNGTTISRNDIVSTGRLLACEFSGKHIYRANDSEKYESRCSANGLDYATLAKNHQRSKILFCAAVANESIGKNPPASYEEALRGNFQNNDAFWKAYCAIDEDVIAPILPSVFEDVAMGGLATIKRVPLGTTYQVNVASNDVFLFEDSAWSSARSASYNYLYGKTVTLTPRPFTSQARFNWYQDVVQGDAGRYYAALMGGMWNKMYALFMGALTTAAGNQKYVPNALKAATYSTTNWNTITSKVAMVNNVTRADLFAFGTVNGLSKVIPMDGTTGAITGFMYGLGEEWFGRGFLPRASGVQLVEVLPVVVPGTQNSSITEISLGSNIYIAAKGGYGYAPLMIALAEGSPMTLTATPRETADLTVDINMTFAADVQPVFASKIGVISYS